MASLNTSGKTAYVYDQGTDTFYAIGGNTNTIDSSEGSSIIGGETNTICTSSADSVIIGSKKSNIDGSNSSVIIGSEKSDINTTSVQSSIISGNTNLINARDQYPSITAVIWLKISSIFPTPFI